MGQISTLFVHKLVGVATEGAELGNRAKRRDWLGSVGVDLDSPVNPKRMIGDADYYDLCERIAFECLPTHRSALTVGYLRRNRDLRRCRECGTHGHLAKQTPWPCQFGLGEKLTTPSFPSSLHVHQFCWSNQEVEVVVEA